MLDKIRIIPFLINQYPETSIQNQIYKGFKGVIIYFATKCTKSTIKVLNSLCQQG